MSKISNDIDFLIISSGEYGTFTWEIPEEIRNLLATAVGTLDDEDKKKRVVDYYKKEVRELVDSWLRLVIRGLLPSPATGDLILNLKNHLENAKLDSREILTSNPNP